jgi:FkbM family methyltransferase
MQLHDIYLSAGLACRTLQVPRGRRQFFLRDASKADEGVFHQIFVNQDYNLARLGRGKQLEDYLRRIAPAKPLILDCGANIGAAAVWFAGCYPHARIVAIEPDPANLALLVRNCQGLDVEPVAGAISCRRETLYLTDPGHGEWGYRTEEHPPSSPRAPTTEAYPVGHFLRAYPEHVPFIVKIDIEGGEDRLFRDDTTWIEAFPLLIIELHDWLLPESASSASFLQAIAPLRRDFVYFSENIFSIRNPI